MLIHFTICYTPGILKETKIKRAWHYPQEIKNKRKHEMKKWKYEKGKYADEGLKNVSN